MTDPGKKSKKGRLSLEVDKDGKYFTSTELTAESKTVCPSISSLDVLFATYFHFLTACDY